MRLSVFSPEISQQLITDLQKLYQGYLSQQQLSEASIEKMLNTSNTTFFVTLFNARHLGAVQVSRNENSAQLNLLCVRDITRRRGVGKNLVREVEKQLKRDGLESITLSLSDMPKSEQEGIKLFLIACGYTFENAQLTKEL